MAKKRLCLSGLCKNVATLVVYGSMGGVYREREVCDECVKMIFHTVYVGELLESGENGAIR